MWTLLKNDGRLRWGALLLLLYLLYTVFHVLLFLIGNGICTGSGTGLIHGTPSDGAGGLPRVTEFENYTRLRPSRPWLSWSDLLAFCFLALSCVWLVVATLLVPFVKLKKQLLQRIALISILILVTLGASSLEQSISCNLRNTHSNIEAMFKIFLAQDDEPREDERSISLAEAIVDMSVEGESLYELKTRYGQFLCRAYVIRQSSETAASSMASRHSYTSWVELSEDIKDASLRLDRLLSRAPNSKGSGSRMHISLKKMDIESAKKTLASTLSHDVYYSAVVCPEWPYDWWNEIE